MSNMNLSSLTDCPKCGQLCVGATLLPCGHLLCRKCLHYLLERDLDKSVNCPTCHSVLRPANAAEPPTTDQFPIDVVMDQLVMKILMEMTAGKCSVPHDTSSSPPTNVCLECGDIFCDSCSHVHINSSLTKRHCLQSLKASDSPPTGQASPPRPRQSDDSSSSDNQKNMLEESAKAEVRLFRQVMSTCDQVTDGMKHLVTRRENDRHVLKAYTDHLLSDDVSLDDVILKRFGHLRRECQSRAEEDMKNLHQMQSRKIFDEKTTPTVFERIGARWEGLCPELSWTPLKVALCVALPVLVSLVLLPLMIWWSAAAVPYTAVPYTAVLYTAERVVLQTLDSSSTSLTPSLCGQHACSSHYDDGVTDVLVTEDRRVVLTMLKQKSIVVKSSSGDQTVQLDCEPFGVTQLPSGLVAVTCPFTPAVLLVSLDGSDPQIQRFQTKKEYHRVAAHPVDNTLIVASLTDNSIDIITLQGEVVRTLADSSQLSLGVITSLTVVRKNLLVTGGGSRQIHQIPLSDSSQPLVETLPGTFPSVPHDTAVDKAGNVFVVLQDGGVMMRSTEGDIRPLLAGREDGRVYKWRRIAHQDNRLLVVAFTGVWPKLKSDVTEYQLLDQ